MVIRIVTPIDTTQWEIGRGVLQSLVETDPRLAPQFYGYSEPFRKQFLDVQSCHKAWIAQKTIREFSEDGAILQKWIMPCDFYWKRRKVSKAWGVMHHPMETPKENFSASLAFYPTPHDAIDWLKLMRTWCEVLRPSFGMLHYFVDVEMSEEELHSAQSYFQLGPPAWLIDKGDIPNLAFANFFGRQFLPDIDVEKLRAKGFRVEELAGGYLVLLMDNLFDVRDNFAEFSRRRVMAKSLFRDDMFLIKDEPAVAKPKPQLSGLQKLGEKLFGRRSSRD